MQTSLTHQSHIFTPAAVLAGASKEFAAAVELDLLDVAYITIGAVEAWGSLIPPDTDHIAFDGQRDFINTVIKKAYLLGERSLSMQWETLSGVWAYDIVEEFGRRYGAALIANTGDVDANAMLEQIIRENTVDMSAPRTLPVAA